MSWFLEGWSVVSEGHLFRRDVTRDYPVLVRGEGVYVWDDAGNRYLDSTSGISVSCIGHGRERVAEALRRQAMSLSYVTSGCFANEPSMRLAERISRHTPGDLNNLFFVTGGSEATETAIKLARRYHLARGNASKYLVVGRRASYHGASLGALSASGHAPRRRPYTPLLLPFPHVAPAYCYRCPFDDTYPTCALACANDLERTLLQVGPEHVAAFIAEPIVGAAAGALVPPPGYLAQIQEICARYDILFIADEVITGFGRTGAWFALEHWGVVPDLLTVAKGMSGGYAPLGAVIVSDRIKATFQENMAAFAHGFTYSDHPLSCAAALEVLSIIEEEDLVAAGGAAGGAPVRAAGAAAGAPKRRGRAGQGAAGGDRVGARQGDQRTVPYSGESGGPAVPAVPGARVIVYPGGGMVEGARGDQLLLCPPYIITRSQIDDLVAMLDDALLSLQHEIHRTEQ